MSPNAHEQIRKAAHRIWELRLAAKEPGDALGDWYRAVAEYEETRSQLS